eukprot:gene459-239_t
MSVVTLQVGQCGNQLGNAVFSRLAEEAANAGQEQFQSEVSRTFFRAPARRHPSTGPNPPQARAVMIDMEPKVVRDVSQNAKDCGKFVYSESAVFTKQEGSANNWAFGYYVQGPNCADDVLNTIRREVEHCDVFGGFHTIQSLAATSGKPNISAVSIAVGGTGSGAGCYLTEQLADLYPRDLRMNTVVVPFSQGEVVMQPLNMIFSIGHLLEHSDGILTIQNDRALSRCAAALGCKSPSFMQMNDSIALDIASLFLPSRITRLPTKARKDDASVATRATISSGQRCKALTSDANRTVKLWAPVQRRATQILTDVLTPLTCSPRHKMFSVESAPNGAKGLSADTWASTLRDVFTIARRHSFLNGQLLLRGTDLPDAMMELGDTRIPMQPGGELGLCTSDVQFAGLHRHAALFYNGGLHGGLFRGLSTIKQRNRRY